MEDAKRARQQRRAQGPSDGSAPPRRPDAKGHEPWVVIVGPSVEREGGSLAVVCGVVPVERPLFAALFARPLAHGRVACAVHPADSDHEHVRSQAKDAPDLFECIVEGSALAGVELDREEVRIGHAAVGAHETLHF